MVEPSALGRGKGLLLAATVVLTLVATGGLVWSMGGAHEGRAKLEIHGNAERGAPVGETIRLVTWNIGYANGVKASYTLVVPRERVEEALHAIANTLQRIDADVVLLQEVDLDSARTFGTDQGEWIARETGYPVRACASVWRRNFVPYPLKYPLGRMDTGMCVLSRLPLEAHERLMLADDPGRSPLINAFYVDHRRYVGIDGNT